MKAIGFTRSLPIDEAESLLDIEIPKPTPGPNDLLVEVRAVSVNPVDTKVRGARVQVKPTNNPGTDKPRVIGWDAAGVVVAKGDAAAGFNVGDEVYYSGELERPGSNAEFQAVDARLVGRKPKTLSFAQAAALPLTSVTAWELLFDRLAAPEASGEGAILITGGAGGVGSILIQLARQLTTLQIIATASRPQTRQWCLDLGAHHVIDHSQPLLAQLNAIGAKPINFIASLTGTTHNFPQLVEVLAPQGKIGVIDDPATLDVVPLKRKAASLHWEFMFARSLFKTPDMAKQGELLNRVADYIDQGILRTTVTQTLSPINAANLKQAHKFVESGRAIGKVTLEGF